MYAAPWAVLCNDPELVMNNADFIDLVDIFCLEAFELLEDLVLLAKLVKVPVSICRVGLSIRSVYIENFDSNLTPVFLVVPTAKVGQHTY